MNSRSATLASTSHVEDRRETAASGGPQQLTRLLGRDGDDFDAAAPGLLVHLRHHGQLARGTGADDQDVGRPWNSLIGRQRCVAVLIPVGFRWTLLPARDAACLDDDVPVEAVTVDLDLTESDESGVQCAPPGAKPVRRHPLDGPRSRVVTPAPEGPERLPQLRGEQ